MNKEEKFYNDSAVEILSALKVNRPTSTQIELIKDILFNTWLKRRIIFDNRLTDREKTCLLLSSHGLMAKQIAKILNISAEVARNYEKQIIKKLSVKNMKQAIAIGIKYGDIPQAIISV